MTTLTDGMREVALRLDEADTLISFPDVCIKLNRILDDPEHSRQDVAKLILFDPAMTARILRMVNSAYYSFSAEVKTINHALNMLSTSELKSLVLVSCLVKSMDHLGKNLDMKKFWKKSVCCGVFAENLAKKSHLYEGEPEEFFICGLILNIGKLLLYYWEPNILDQILYEMRENGRQDHEVEKEYLGFTHADVGSSLAIRWKFPHMVAESIANHHNYSAEKGPENPVMYSADLICSKMDFDTMEPVDLSELNVQELVENLNISEEEFAQVMEDSHKEFQDIYDAFFTGL